jgi:hypothetical protein
LAITIQDDVLGGISRAEAKVDSCREKRKVATAIVETGSKVWEFSSSLGGLRVPVSILQHDVRNAATKESRDFRRLLDDLGIARQLAERGRDGHPVLLEEARVVKDLAKPSACPVRDEELFGSWTCWI